ncbi:hypothetical protein DI43_12915 [Geobacillus sp. CAMR12739]|nr:hypothetical protein DI43_12915 [Geobacillus sp. CAMR12739]
MKGQAVYPAAAALFAVAAASPSKTTCLLLIVYLLLLFIRRPHCFLPALVAALFFFVYFLIVDHHNKTSLSGGRHSLSVRFSAAPAIDGDRLQAAVQAGKERVQLVTSFGRLRKKKRCVRVLCPGSCAG